MANIYWEQVIKCTTYIFHLTPIYEWGTIISPALQMEKLKHKEINLSNVTKLASGEARLSSLTRCS